MNDEISLISKLIFALMIFSFIGWCTAEADNDVLRQELSLYKGEEVRK